MGSTSLSFAIIFATLFGPIFAVQAQSFVEERREQKRRRVGVFRTLLTTRMSLTVQNVEALNSVPLEFHGQAQIIENWKTYFEYVSDKSLTPETPEWENRRKELYVALLVEISRFLGYKFTRQELQREIYKPQAFLDQESIAARLNELFPQFLETFIKFVPKANTETSSETPNLEPPKN